MRIVHNVEVHGVEVDTETRCAHWDSPLDVIAIKFKCCGRWYPCFACHSSIADHATALWTQNEFGEKAILCGACGHQLSIDEYLASDNTCPQCSASFNPGCAKHYHLYFAADR